MKNLLNLDGVRILRKKEKQSIHGGASYACGCVGKPTGARCKGCVNGSIGECATVGGGTICAFH